MVALATIYRLRWTSSIKWEERVRTEKTFYITKKRLKQVLLRLQQENDLRLSIVNSNLHKN